MTAFACARELGASSLHSSGGQSMYATGLRVAASRCNPLKLIRDKWYVHTICEQTIDSIDRPTLWAIMMEYGVPDRPVELSSDLHADTSQSVKIDVHESQPFAVHVGVGRAARPRPCC
eukprot:365362-Chlamydomonas_euryale.AAC.16